MKERVIKSWKMLTDPKMGRYFWRLLTKHIMSVHKLGEGSMGPTESPSILFIMSMAEEKTTRGLKYTIPYEGSDAFVLWCDCIEIEGPKWRALGNVRRVM